MNDSDILNKALKLEFINEKEALYLYKNAELSTLSYIANEIRKKLRPKAEQNKVGWIIDRNVNITNVCFVQCKFCNFCRKINDKDAYITTIEQYKQKIEELLKLGGDQLLLQGGLHPKLDLNYYKNLFLNLKNQYPTLKLHALGPAEIIHLSNLSKKPIKEVLKELIKSGLDSLPGAGAEILSDRVRQKISKAKCSSDQWLEVMRQAHKLNLPTSATMMFGHIETLDERIEHLIKLRNLQAEKQSSSNGFITFVPWPYQKANTLLEKEMKNYISVKQQDYIKLIAISRIVLVNIKNIQASWLTVGKQTAQLSLYAGANDFGSIMIEENVVSAAGANYQFNEEGIQNAISEAGFIPARRNQKYEFV